MFYLDCLYVCINRNNGSLLISTCHKSYHDDPLFSFHFWVAYMHICNFAKGQMSHLPN